MPTSNKLKVFICHSSQDKPVVRELYEKLAAESWIEPWLDERSILPGQRWNIEIERAINEASIILICLSKVSVGQEGYIQKEIRKALDIEKQKPEDTIFIITLRLNECEPPDNLREWQWVDYFEDFYYDKLINALRVRARQIGGILGDDNISPIVPQNNLCSYVYIPESITAPIPYSFYISTYPVTNSQFERFINSPTCLAPKYWSNFPKYGNTKKANEHWGQDGVDWLKGQLKGYESFPQEKLIERGNLKQKIWSYWDHPNLGQQKPNNPVVGINWYVANAYCKWLYANWENLDESRVNKGLSPKIIRLPLESEWLFAAGGRNPSHRYPWNDPYDFPKQITEKVAENPIVMRLLSWVVKGQRERLVNSQNKIIDRANVFESLLRGTTPVDAYPNGASPYGVMDMAGNVWEYVADFVNGIVPLHGGSWKDKMAKARVGYLLSYNFGWVHRWDNVGFRLVIDQVNNIK